MLPPMSADNDETPELTKNDLSDHAIELLYDIVRRAQSSSDHSSRALFNAYEDVLTEQGLVPQDDSVLHRFLFYMQRDRIKNESLVQRFKRVLGKINITVECDSEGEGIEVTTNLDLENQHTLGHGHSRRGSFDSFFDGTADKVAGNGIDQELPLRTRRGSQNVNGDRWSNRRSRSDTDAPSYQQPQLPIRTRTSSIGSRIRSLDQGQPRQRRTGSVSSRGSIQIRRHGRNGSAQIGGYDADSSDRTEETDELDLSNIQIPGINAPIPQTDQRAPSFPIEPFRPSDTRLLDDAESFEHQRIHRVARDCIQTWRNRTRDQIEKHKEMELAAAAFDRKIVTRIALDQLLDTARVKQSNRETERFFGRLENRAKKARNLFLLTKAFTHWAKSTEDEVQRTSVARRHLLRTKFFNGWREITAVNDFKIQQFALGKFLRIWRTRTQTIRENRNFATFLYEENLRHRIYKDWFFKFCTIAAPAWRNDRTRRKTLQKWNQITTTLRDREEWATKKRDRVVVTKTLQIWIQNTRRAQVMETQAERFRNQGVISSYFHTLHKKAQLAPLLRRFEDRANSGRVRASLQVWRHNFQLSRLAQNVDRMRVLRNAWTAWNDRLRIKALEERINDRVLIESLYKWTLASRVSLFQRVHNRQVKESVFRMWISKTTERANSLEVAERQFSQFKRAQLLRSCLHKLENATAERRGEEFAVTAEYQQKLKQRIFNKMIGQHEHLQELNQWAGDARFYVLATNTLKKWNEATQHARRNRRRDMYAQVRRTVKTNLVRRFFNTWREKATVITEQDRQAIDIRENRVLQTTTNLLARWRSRTAMIEHNEVLAYEVRVKNLQLQSLQAWTQQVEVIQAMEARSLVLRQESTELAAASALKKLGWKIWNVRRQEENARALYERNFKKHTRAMIRFWLEQAVERSGNRAQSPTPSRRSRGRSQNDDDEDADLGGNGGLDTNKFVELDEPGDDTRRLEAWTAFDETGLGLHDNLDLSFSLSPKNDNPAPQPIPTPRPPAPASASALQQFSLPIRRPQTVPQSQPQSALRPPPIPEDAPDFGDPSNFWASTPMPPTISKPGYLKTPSKRSVARAKRPELPASPEKRGTIGILGRGNRGLGVMSAPPVQGGRNVPSGGVTSFERRLREGGFGSSVAGDGNIRSVGGTGRGVLRRGKGRVGFGDVSELG